MQGLAKNSFKTAEDPEEAPLQPSTPWGHLFRKLLKFYFEGLTISVFWWWWFIILGFCLFAWGGSLEGWVVSFFFRKSPILINWGLGNRWPAEAERHPSSRKKDF